MKILIVDKNQELTATLSNFLVSKGFSTIVSNNSWDALDFIQQELFDVIILDLQMPEFSGEKIIQILATNEILKNQNIFIFLENLDHPNIIKNWLRKDGINGCLTKQMPADEILKAITN